MFPVGGVVKGFVGESSYFFTLFPILLRRDPFFYLFGINYHVGSLPGIHDLPSFLCVETFRNGYESVG